MERETTPRTTRDQGSSREDERREFLKGCGKFGGTTLGVGMQGPSLDGRCRVSHYLSLA